MTNRPVIEDLRKSFSRHGAGTKIQPNGPRSYTPSPTHIQSIYEQVGPHPCLAQSFGINDENALILRRMRNGSIPNYLLKIPVLTQWVVDIAHTPELFALAGVVMFLLSWQHPCAAVPGLNGWTSDEEYLKRIDAHERGEFDQLNPARFGEHFAQVVERGFRLEHTDAQEFARELMDAFKHWKEAFSRGKLPDPDTMVPEIPADATDATVADVVADSQPF
ncbi:hypothetical protein B0H17DRAFT_1196853 [Mycena rosella]|uniref:Uncharacterized protein n=1 Tax=Mycena rosella TaxID=1033263 RepID=A0AAD7DSN0_MYCRO|nr:hypothetical protein B0H17DRAFT_1196853 [Mycena rosella]